MENRIIGYEIFRTLTRFGVKICTPDEIAERLETDQQSVQDGLDILIENFLVEKVDNGYRIDPAFIQKMLKSLANQGKLDSFLESIDPANPQVPANVLAPQN